MTFQQWHAIVNNISLAYYHQQQVCTQTCEQQIWLVTTGFLERIQLLSQQIKHSRNVHTQFSYDLISFTWHETEVTAQQGVISSDCNRIALKWYMTWCMRHFTLIILETEHTLCNKKQWNTFSKNEKCTETVTLTLLNVDKAGWCLYV